MNKKIVILLLAVILALSLLCSCDAEKDKVDKGDKEGTADTTTVTDGTQPSAESTTGASTGDVTADKPAQTDAPHVHSFSEWSVKKEPTCQKEGQKGRYCDCGEIESENIAKVKCIYKNGKCTMCGGNDPDAFVPDYADGEANTVGNYSSLGVYAKQGNKLYFSRSLNDISKINLDGTGFTSVYKDTKGIIANINVVGDWIYFFCKAETQNNSYIGKVRTDGEGFEKIVRSVSVGDMLVVKDKIFYTTDVDEYIDFSKDVMPLYIVSTDGSSQKQISDGAVLQIASDGSYVYYMHMTEEGESTICRVKSDGTNKNELLINSPVISFSLKNSKLYFLVMDQYSDECTLASISAKGGSYTTYGKLPYYSNILYVVNNKAYYYGSPYVSGGFSEDAGLIEYDMSTKRYKLVREDFDISPYYFVSDLIIVENYENSDYTVDSVSVYDVAKGTWKKLSFK